MSKYSVRELEAIKKFIDLQSEDIVLRLEKTIALVSDPNASHKGSLVIPNNAPIVEAIKDLMTAFDVLEPSIATSENKALDSEGFEMPDKKGDMWGGIPFITQRDYPSNFAFCYASLRNTAVSALVLKKYCPPAVDEDLDEFVGDVIEVAKLLCEVTGQTVPGLQ